MITEIAYQIVKNLSEKVAFIDKWAGLVMPMKKSVNKVEKTMPVAIKIDLPCANNECTGYVSSDYMDLVPDSNKKSVCYIEQVGDITLEQLRKNVYLASANLRVVLWYNLNHITEGEYLDEGVIAYNLLSNIPYKLTDDLFVYSQNVNISVNGTTSGADIFSKYSYDEVRTQFVTFPYGAIAIDLNVTYTINKCAFNLIPLAKCGEITT